jgi:hypothetical protein
MSTVVAPVVPSNLKVFSNVPSVKSAVSLRSLAYNNYDALCDLIDNSIDAAATKVSVNCKQKSPNDPTDRIITVADNGCGMNEATLLQAIRLGSETQHKPGDLGFFGMGLLTASWSMTPQVKVLTRNAVKGTVLCGVTDLDYMERTKTWDSFVGLADDKEVKLFNSLLRDGTGTVVVLERIEERQCKTRRLSSFVNEMLSKAGLVFHELLMFGNIAITINGEKVLPIDPLLRDLSDTEVDRTDDDVEVDIGGGRTGKCKVRTMLLVDSQRVATEENEAVIKRIKAKFGNDKDRLVKDLTGPTTRFTGVYFVRNMRVIKHYNSFQLFGKVPHHELQSLRVMIEFDQSLDAAFGLSFKKSELEPPQSVFDKIKMQVVSPRLMETRRWYGKKQIKDASESLTDEEKKAKAVIEPMAKLLGIRPPPDEKKPDEKKSDEKKSDEKKPENHKDKAPQHHDHSRFEIEHIHTGPHSPVWDIGAKGGKVVVKWNVDHPFWLYCVVPAGSPDKVNYRNNLMTAINLIAYGLGAAAFAGKTDLIDTNLKDSELLAAHNTLVESMSRCVRTACEIQTS